MLVSRSPIRCLPPASSDNREKSAGLQRVVESEREAMGMARISDRALSIFKDACGIYDFSDIEQAQIEVLAEQLREILRASKERQKKKPAKHN